MAGPPLLLFSSYGWSFAILSGRPERDWGFIGIEEVDAAWLEVGTPVTLDLFVNHQVAGRLTSIPRDGLTILIGPVEQPAGSEG